MAALQPFTLYMLGPSSNPWKVAFVMEELGLQYKVEQVDHTTVKQEPFISVNPNGRAPALIDPNNNDIILWESGAIIDYLIDRYDKEAKLHYETGPEKYLTRCWEHFQMSGQGPYFGQKTWFSKFHTEKLPSAIERYLKEVQRVIGVLETHLAKEGTEYLVGDKITYADLMFLPYFHILRVVDSELDIKDWKAVNAWLERIKGRPAIANVIKKWDVVIAEAFKNLK